jgi:hypothetical protein
MAGRYVTMQDGATGTGNGTSISCRVLQYPVQAIVQVFGTFVATVTFEATVDGSNWIAVALADMNDTSRTRGTTATGAGLFLLDNAAGLDSIRSRVSTYTSGTVNVVGCIVEGGR